MHPFNRNLLFVILSVWIAVGWKLYITAAATDNFRGFLYSLLHVVIVGVGVFFALRKKVDANPS